MTTSDALSVHAGDPTPNPIRRDPFGALARCIESASPGERAALARLDPETPLRPHQLAALARVLTAADFDPGSWDPRAWKRWTLVAHGMALADHDSSNRFGDQLHLAGVAESRVARLLVSRGTAFVQQLPRLLRLMAGKAVAPNWRELGALVLKDGSREGAAEAEDIRMRIAAAYYSAEARAK